MTFERDRIEADRWSRLAGATETLVRSRLEIERVLRSVAEKETPVTAFFPLIENLFMSRLRQVDASLGFVTMEYGSGKATNAAMLKARSVRLRTNDGDSNIEFIGLSPAETMLSDQTPGIRIQFPQELLIQQRRSHKRIPSLPDAHLRCIADNGGVISFEAEIVDLSVGGFGAMSYGNGITLEPGTVLRKCKVILPDGSAINVDIEIRHSAIVTLKDGKQACRSGCRFLGDKERIEGLMKVFVLDLEALNLPES